MPRFIGRLEVPRDPPHFLRARLAVRRHLRAYPAEHVVVGLSGGADSLALLAAARAEGLNVHAVCVDHQLQEGSAAVARRAARQAEHLGATAAVRAVDVDERGSMEAAARTARYAALTEAGGPVWVAHTLDDQAETYLLAGLRGNPAGMLPKSGLIERPLLEIRRENTVGACAELGLQPWRDPQNADPAFRRVAVRTRVLPLLREVVGGEVAPALAQAARRAAEDDAALNDHVSEVAELPVEVAADPPALRRRRIAALLRGHGVAVTGASISAVDALLTDWHGQGPVAVGGSSAGRVVVQRSGGWLRVTSGGG